MYMYPRPTRGAQTPPDGLTDTSPVRRRSPPGWTKVYELFRFGSWPHGWQRRDRLSWQDGFESIQTLWSRRARFVGHARARQGEEESWAELRKASRQPCVGFWIPFG